MRRTVSSTRAADVPPVVLLGGSENAVACARYFVAAGITTVVVQSEGAPALHSRGVVRRQIDATLDAERIAAWLSGDGLEWSGSVVLPLSD